MSPGQWGGSPVAKSTHPQPCAEAPDVAETIERTFATHRNAVFTQEMTMHARDTEKTVAAWLLLWCSVVLAPLAARADVVTDWNLTAIRAAQAAGQPNPMFARNLAMVHAAIYDAVNAIDRSHTVYAVDATAKPGASLEAAAAAAAYGVLTTLYWTQTPAFEVALEESLAAIPEGPARADGLAIGAEVAQALLAQRKDDRSNAPVTYTPTSEPGGYQLTPPAFASVALPHWGGVTPFLLTHADQFPLAGPPALTSAAFANDLNEVKAVGAKHSSTRTRDQTDAARLWIASPIVTDNDAARQLSAHQGLNVVDNARVFALLNMAGADALIACWEAKYRYNYWRPVTAIRHADSAGNSGITADPAWEPLIPTPAHPEYPSGRTSYTGATARVLREFFGEEVRLSLANPAVKVTRTYQSLAQMGREVEDARVWGGMHYRTAVVHGSELGRSVADYGLKHHLRPVGARAGK
jgi:PAP2 superfamily